ncbi:MAG: hypothetical protein R3A79_18965 [Nannocystaceae bacterium]
MLFADAATIDPGISEFGELLAEYLAAVQDCRGAVLTDEDGHPIDYARRRDAISELDLQIVGAQIERPLTILRERGGDPDQIRVTIDAARGVVVAAAIGGEYSLVALHAAATPRRCATRIEEDFEWLVGRMRHLIRR